MTLILALRHRSNGHNRRCTSIRRHHDVINPRGFHNKVVFAHEKHLFEADLIYTCKSSAFLIIVGLLLPVPQFYVVLLEKSSRACDYPLLSVNVASIVFTFFTIGFTVIFCAMVPVPRPVKIAFHIFGLGTFILGIIMMVYTWFASEDCDYSVPELYILSLCGSWLAGLSIVFVVFMLPFWIINKAKPSIVMDPYSRTGICYEPTKCCTCLWHISGP